MPRPGWSPLYQEQSKEGSSKTEELSRAVREVQGLLQEAREGQAKVQAEREEGTKHHQKLDNRQETVTALRKELEVANKLLKTVEENGLNKDGIAGLCPCATQASRLLNSLASTLRFKLIAFFSSCS